MDGLGFCSDPAQVEGGIYSQAWSLMVQTARPHSIDSTLETIGSKIRTIQDSCTAEVAQGPLQWEGQRELHLRFVWYLFLQAASHCSRIQDHDRLIVELMLIRGIGALPTEPEDDGTTARVPGLTGPMTSDGCIFVDLPWLVHDFTREAELNCATMSYSQRRNLHAFLATLGGIGLDDRLCGIGVLMLRSALETPRELGSTPADSDAETEQQERYKSRTLDHLTVAELLVPAELWLTKAGDRLTDLGRQSYCNFPARIGQLGPLARDAGVPDNGGLSLQRVQFWMRRRREVAEVLSVEREGPEDARMDQPGST